MSEFNVTMFSSIMYVNCGDGWMGSLQCQTGPDKSFYFYPKLSVLCFGSCHWIFQPDTKPAENHLRMLHCVGFFVCLTWFCGGMLPEQWLCHLEQVTINWVSLQQ